MTRWPHGRTALAALVALTLAGCATVPTSGPVEQVSVNPARVQRGIQITPAPPVPNASLDAVIYGFLAAMAAPDPGYSAARQYLTPEAAKSWQVDDGVTVYLGDAYGPVFTNNQASLRAPVVGRLDTDGRFTSAWEPDFSFDFGVVQIDGQWRISNPPDGLLISQFLFERFYEPRPVYFVSKSSGQMAPELRYFADAEATPTMMIEGLESGPSEWLAPAVRSALPTGLTLDTTGVTVSRGVADVPFVGFAVEMEDATAMQLAGQVLWSLSSFDEVASARITINGEPLSVRGADSSGLLDLADVASLRVPANARQSDAYLIQGGVLKRLAADTNAVSPVMGALGTAPWRDKLADLDVHSTRGLVAAVTTDGSGVVSSALDTAGQASTVITGRGLLRPQILDDGRIVSVDGANRLYVAASGKPAVSVPIEGLPPGRVTAFRVSPDGTRIAVVVTQGSTTQLGLVRMTGTGPWQAGGWQALVPSVSLGPLSGFRDVGWAGENSLMVLASAPDAQAPGAYQFTSAATGVTGLGPPGQISMTRLAAQPQTGTPSVVALTENGRAMRYQERSRWVPLASDVVAIALG